MPDEHVDWVCEAAHGLKLDEDQVSAALRAEFGRPANKVPPHQRIFNALKAAATPKVYQEARSVDEDPVAKAFRQMRMSGGYPAGMTNLEVIQDRAVTIAAKETRLYGAPSRELLRQTEQDLATHTTLDPDGIYGEMIDLFGRPAADAFYAAQEAIAVRMQSRRVTERNVVKSAGFDKASVEDRLKMMAEAFAGGGEWGEV